MSIWQDSTGALHDDANGAALTLSTWPKGMTQLTSVQAQVLINPPLTAAQMRMQAANQFVGTGISVTSTAFPAINGTYSISQGTMALVNMAEAFVLRNNSFPGGATSFPFADINGVAKIFTDLTTWGLFATALANIFAQVDWYVNGYNNQTALPSSTITLP